MQPGPIKVGPIGHPKKDLYLAVYELPPSLPFKFDDDMKGRDLLTPNFYRSLLGNNIKLGKGEGDENFGKENQVLKKMEGKNIKL